MTEKKVTEAKELRFTKSQLSAAKRYRNEQDLINALMEDGKTYTLDEANDLINTYLKGSVK